MSESIPEAQRTAPEKIWLHLGDMGDIDMPYDPTDDITWVDQPIDDNSIPYVRADLVSQASGSEGHPGEGGLTADLSDEQLEAAASAGWEEAHLCTNGRLNSRNLAAFRSVAELARQGWRPILPNHSASVSNMVKFAPVEVSERLPGLDDLDANGRLWVYQNQKSTTHWISARDLPGLTPIHYHTGTVWTIERTTLPPRPESWAVRCGNECLTTDGSWVNEDQPSNRHANWLTLHRFPSLQEAWDALQRARQPKDRP